MIRIYFYKVLQKTTSFLSGKYLQNYRKFLLGDFSEILDKDYYEQQKSFLESKA